jgi:hypothetical protein
MRTRVCYLDYHEAWLCCYLVIHILNLLRPLQLFYFRFWPVYWLSLVHLCTNLNFDPSMKGWPVVLKFKCDDQLDQKQTASWAPSLSTLTPFNFNYKRMQEFR